MGYASYTIQRNGETIEAGYAIEATCEEPGCEADIDRGLAHLCGQTPGGDEYGCGGYYCGSHLYMGPSEETATCADGASPPTRSVVVSPSRHMSHCPHPDTSVSAATSSPQHPPGAFCMSGGAMDPAELYPEDLVYGHEASAATGVPEVVIRKWASRGKIARFQGSPRQYSGQGHEYKTMYALPEVKAAAAGYRPRMARSAA